MENRFSILFTRIFVSESAMTANDFTAVQTAVIMAGQPKKEEKVGKYFLNLTRSGFSTLKIFCMSNLKTLK